jgi:hypothetical protein
MLILFVVHFTEEAVKYEKTAEQVVLKVQVKTEVEEGIEVRISLYSAVLNVEP